MGVAGEVANGIGVGRVSFSPGSRNDLARKNRGTNVGVEKTGQVHGLRIGEVHENNVVLAELLLVGDVVSVYARVVVVLVKNRDTGSWAPGSGTAGGRKNAGGGWLAKSREPRGGMLLPDVGGKGADLA